MTAPGPLSVLAPFSITLWVTLLCTIIAVALLFWGLDAYGRWIRNRQFDALRASGVLSAGAVARAKKEDGNPVLISFMAAAGAPERPGRNSWGVQVMYVVYCFFCLIVLSSYTANLTSYLAVRRSYVGIGGLQDMVKINGLVGVNPNGSTAAYFATSKDSLATQLQPNVRYCDTTTCVSWVRQSVVQAFVTDEPVLQYLSQQQPCDTTVVGDPFGPGNLVIGLQKNSSLLPLFNTAIQTFSEDGTLSTLRRAWFDGLSQCGSDTQLDSTRLSVSQMLGAFLFLVMGIVVAFSIGTVENLKWCLARAYAKAYSESGTPAVTRSSTMPPSSEGQLLQRRGPMLLQQASRLRTATWRRISVSLLGISHPQLPPTRPDSETTPPLQQQPPTAGKSVTFDWQPPSPSVSGVPGPPPAPPQLRQSASLPVGAANYAVPALLRISGDPPSPLPAAGHAGASYPGAAIAAVAAAVSARERGKALPGCDLAADLSAAAAAAATTKKPLLPTDDVSPGARDAAAAAGFFDGGKPGGGSTEAGGRGIRISGTGTVWSSPLGGSPRRGGGGGGSGGDSAAEDGGGGSALPMPSLLLPLPLSSFTEPSSGDVQDTHHGRNRVSGAALPGQPSCQGADGGAGGGWGAPAPPPPPLLLASLPPPPPLSAVPSGRLSARRLNWVTPSQEGSASGALFLRREGSDRGLSLPQEPQGPVLQPARAAADEPPPPQPLPHQHHQPQQPQQRVSRPPEDGSLEQPARAVPSAPAPTSPAPAPATRPLSTSRSTDRTFPYEDELTTFSDVSSSDDDEARSPVRASLSFAGAAAGAPGLAVLEAGRSSDALRRGTF